MPNSSKIKSIKAREIIDSRGNPTVEVELETDLGKFIASVPSGVSKGKYEAMELRDGGKRYQGMGVLKAVRNINKIIAPKLKGKEVTKQKEIDDLMIKLDGTKNKSKLGANAICGVSMAACRAEAAAKGLPLYRYLNQLYRERVSAKFTESGSLPTACFNIINGGAHAGNKLDFQEFMIVPAFAKASAGKPQFKKSLQIAVEIYHQLKELLSKKYGKESTNLGDEGGFTPPISQTHEALNLIMEAIKLASYKKKIKIGLDCAASQFFKKGKYQLDKKIFSREGLVTFYRNLIKTYPILFIEDPFSEDDWQGWKKISNLKSQNSNLLIFGDDLTVTNSERIKLAYKRRACNGIIIKPNQIGTITETIEAVKLAKDFGWKIMVSHRSGETNDDFISDLAVGIGADFIKAGAPARGERVAKYNRLLEIEEELK